MLKSLKNRRNRKGFTLAELLIVVAIIAVLVAIAVPLFVGSLENAEQRVFESNARSLKGMAASALLGSKDFDANTITGDGMLVEGTVDKQGNLAITNWETEEKEPTKWEDYKTAKWNGTGDTATKTIVVKLTKATIEEYKAPVTP